MHVMILIHYSYASLWNRCFFSLHLKNEMPSCNFNSSAFFFACLCDFIFFSTFYSELQSIRIPKRLSALQTEWDSINFELLHLNIQMDTLDEIKPACFYCNQSCSSPGGRHNTRKHKRSGRLWSYVQMPDEHGSICTQERTWCDQTWRESPALE